METEKNEDRTDTEMPLYGWGKVTPNFFQRFNKPSWLLLSLCFCSITQGMLINGLVPASLSTLEKRFRLTSFQSSLFAIAYDIAVCVSLIPVSHFGGKGHKGRWLSVGMLIMAFGSFVCTLPQFISEPFSTTSKRKANFTTVLDCSPQESALEDDRNARSLYNENLLYFLLLLTGQILHGVGGTPIYTLGITFLDESVPENKSAFYLGIFLGSSVLGPALGFVGGGFYLRIHGDWLKVDTATIQFGHNDMRWYGAWWIGFIAAAFMSLIASFIIAGFGLRLPGRPLQLQSGGFLVLTIQPTVGLRTGAPVREVNNRMGFASTGGKTFWCCVMKILKSWTFLWLVVVDCLEAILSTGVVNFFPKIVENFFSISASTAGLVTGIAIVPSAVIGTVTGGYVINKFQLGVPGMCAMAFVADLFCLFCGSSFLLYCPTRNVVGVTVPYGYLPYDAVQGHP